MGVLSIISNPVAGLLFPDRCILFANNKNMISAKNMIWFLRALFVFFVSRRFASRIHEISDLKKKALVLSLRAGYTRLRDQKKTY